MSLWTSIRDFGEAAASVAGNYFLPGSGLVTSQLISQGAQQDLGTPVGQLAMLGSGLSGAGVGSDYTGIPASGGWNSLTGGGAPVGSAYGPDNIDVGGGFNPATAGYYPVGSVYGPDNIDVGGGFNPVTGSTALPAGAGEGGSVLENLRRRFGQLGSGGGGAGTGTGGLPSGLRTALGGMQLLGGLQQYQAQSQRQAQQQGYAQQLQQLMANPASVESLPGYQAGLRAVQRRARAEGFGGSGSMAAALAGYGGQQYQQQLSNLAALQGASQPVGSPMMGLVGAGLGAYNLFG